MNINNLLSLIPPDWPHSIKNHGNRKIICEKLLDEIINQIDAENRNLTQWELDRLTEAIKAIRFGNYVLACNEIMSTLTPIDKISNSEICCQSIKDDLALDKLCRDIARLKGEPPRVN